MAVSPPDSGQPARDPKSRRRLTRRQFVHQGLLLSGAAVTPGLASSSHAAPVRWRGDDTLRVGAIGVGRRSRNLISRLGYSVADIRSGIVQAVGKPVEGAELVAICDVFDGNLQSMAASIRKAGGDPKLYRDYREMLTREDLDAVIVATPDFSHAPIAQFAVEQGCDVYVEKCAAHSPDQLRALEAAVAKHKAIVQVGYQLRQDNINQQAAEVVRRGWIGEVRLVTCDIHRSGTTGALTHPLLEYGDPPSPDSVDWDLFLAGLAPERPYDPERFFEWRKFWDYCNGTCGDNESHVIDAAEFVAGVGMPGAAVSSGRVWGDSGKRETPNMLVACLEYPEEEMTLRFTEIDTNSGKDGGQIYYGTEGTMHVSWELAVYPDRFSEKYAESFREKKLNPSTPMIHLKDPAAAAMLEGNPSELWLAGRGAARTTRGKGEFDTTRLHLEEFFECVRSRQEPSASLAKARASTIGAQMSARSIREGRRITPADLGFGAEAPAEDE